MTFDRNISTGLSAKPDISFLDDILDSTEDTMIVASDKFDPSMFQNMFQNGVHVDGNGNVTRLAENWEEILEDLTESGFEL